MEGWFLSKLKEGEEVSFLFASSPYFSFQFAFLLKLGACSVLVPFPRSISKVIDTFNVTKPSIFFGINPLFQAFSDHKKAKKMDFSNLKISLAGAVPLQKEVFEKWKKMTGHSILEVYTITEACGFAAIKPFSTEGFEDFTGIPPSSTLIEIRGEEGQEVSVGEVGEIAIGNSGC